MEAIPEGGIVNAKGFKVGSSRCGLKSAAGEPDVAVILCDPPAGAAGVFTTNKFAAAPVRWSRERLPSENLKALVVNSGNANACTGKPGMETVEVTARLVAELAGCEPNEVAVASTGIIGKPLDFEKLSGGIRDAFSALSDTTTAASRAERAIMTTDTVPKSYAVRSEIGGKPFVVAGMSKGSGMIAPRMATMLAFLTTDAAVPLPLLQQTLRDCVDQSFNRITVDGDTSTNDSVFLLASGASGAEVTGAGAGLAQFREALADVTRELALKIVRDGEGATKLIAISVSGAAEVQQAERVARAVAHSPLVKCAVHGGDPNWGRIVCAAGYSGVDVDPEKLTLLIGEKVVFRDGVGTGADASEQMRGKEVAIHLELGMGDARATVWTCDLSKKYVDINALYHT